MIHQVTLRDSYKDYKKQVDKPVDGSTYYKITGGMYQFMMEKVLDGSHDVELGGGESLGTIGIRGTKSGKLKPDWKETYKLWNNNPQAKADREYIYFLNDHSNGITYHFYWWKEGMKIGFKSVYALKYSKGNRRRLKELAFEGQEWLLRVKKETNKQHEA